MQMAVKKEAVDRGRKQRMKDNGNKRELRSGKSGLRNTGLWCMYRNVCILGNKQEELEAVCAITECAAKD